jgi:hypothetical protein
VHLPPRQTLSAALVLASFVAAGCAHAPPPDFAPDPGLVAQVREIRILTTYPRVCPGGVIQANYEALLADGSLVPFARTYDKNHPPRLHVVFLELTSADAVPQVDGDWSTNGDPLATVNTGFRLTVTLRAKSSVTRTLVVPPDYSCMRRAFVFTGNAGGPGEPGENGLDITVRLAQLHSQFYDHLFVVGFQIGLAQPFYGLYDASTAPPISWLVIESRGGRGGAGVAGANGTDGTAGTSGCPAQPGGPGGNGGPGGPGSTGGRGGRISIIVPADNPLLAGIIDAHSPGGPGGPGGAGGTGGKGGKGGQGTVDAYKRPCPNASDGSPGQNGIAGANGSAGPAGARSLVVTLPTKDLFGLQVPPGLGSLLEQLQRRP